MPVKKAKPATKVTSHTRRNPAGKRAQVTNSAQVQLHLDTPKTMRDADVGVALDFSDMLNVDALKFSMDSFYDAFHDEKHAYHNLARFFVFAYGQAACGKGKQRHATSAPFTAQPMQSISFLLGSHDGLAYQVIKKVQESQRMALVPALNELAGAAVYVAGLSIHREAIEGFGVRMRMVTEDERNEHSG